MVDQDLKDYLFFKDKYRNDSKEKRIRIYNLLKLAIEDIENNRTIIVEDKSFSIVSMILGTITILFAIDKFVNVGQWYSFCIMLIVIFMCIVGLYYLHNNKIAIKDSKKKFKDERSEIHMNKLELQALKELLSEENNFNI